MPADLKLGGTDGKTEWLIAEGAVFKAEVSDLMLDSAARRSGGGPHRRALVHDFGDGLTINFKGDYPGGVTIRDAKLNLRVVTQGLEAELPANGSPGDVLLIFHQSSDAVTFSSSSLWVCVPAYGITVTPGAWWQRIPLEEPVQGTA
jgi:hypothetical protein